MPDPLNTQRRRYAMTRISAGDYLLPSNDGQTLWRISAYTEDGSAEYQDEHGKWHKVTGTFWQTAKYPRDVDEVGEIADPDFLEWANWTTWQTGFRTRAEAVRAVLA